MQHCGSNSIFYSSKGLSQRRRDLGVAHSLEVCHFERDPLLLRQRSQRLLNCVARIRKNENIGFGGRRRPVFLWIKGLRVFFQPAGGTKRVDRPCTCDREKPTKRFSPRRIVSGRLLPYLPENIRQDIFSVGPISNNSENQTKRDAVVARIKRIQRVGVFRCHALDQLAVFLFNARFIGHWPT